MKPIFKFLFVGAFVLSACAAAVTETPPTAAPVNPAGSTMPALTDPDQPIAVKAGELVMIVVESNPTTGYHWEMPGSLDGAHLEFVSREYTAAEPVMVGSGGVEVWTLKAVAAGEASFVLGNYPPGQGSSAEQEKHFTINIQ